MRLHAIGAGPLVVKIAGLAGGVRLYREEMEEAARAGFRVAALDTAGDRRDDPAPGRLTWDSMADEVFQAIERLGEERAILWGTSFGCLVALAAAARRPERVAALLLCHPPDPGSRPRAYLGLSDWAAGRPDPDAVIRKMFCFGFALLAGWEFLYPAALRRSRFLMREALDARTPARTIADKIRLLWGEAPGLPSPEAAIASAIVAGAWDTITPPRLARDLAERMPGCRLRILACSGHAGAFSRPRGYGKIVVEELSRLNKNPSPRRGGGDEWFEVDAPSAPYGQDPEAS